MLVTRSSDYALRALIYLAGQPKGRIVPLREISTAQTVPKALLSKILQSFRKDGIVRSYRGVGGGFVLNRDPEKITLRDVIERVDGPIVMFECMEDDSYCNFWSDCSLLGAFERTQVQILDILQGVTVADCARGSLVGIQV